ncbi:MAG: NrfD/PsrC family molybdoenzyme membrane anchor subunit [Polyangiales bacterium]
MSAAERLDEIVAQERDEVPVLIGKTDDTALTKQLLGPIWRGSRWYLPLLVITGLGAAGLMALVLYTAITGIGVWGNNIPVAWGFGIINFVWWIGIGHAGTFISAVLLLFQAQWRTSINRVAEAMTLFAVMNAAIFPLLHTGRPWFAYWLIPFPNTMDLWPNFRSALPWDAAAVSTYGLTSLLFWYLGLVPDLAAMRDASQERWRRQIYGVFAMGWRGSARHWQHYRIAYGLLAGLATPLVLSVHTIVSLDFAESNLPGWHSPIFPPFFVAGAIYSGFAMVLTLLIPIRSLYGMKNVVTMRHLDNIAKMLLTTGWVVTYAYIIEIFVGWYSGNPHERYVHLVNRPFGFYAFFFWLMILCNCVVPQLFWSKRLRRNIPVLFIASILINVGMWLERFILIVTSEHRDFLPSSWASYFPSLIDGAIFLGTLFFFSFLYLLFLRFVPFIPVSEVKELRHELEHHAHHEHDAKEADSVPA